MGSFVVRVWLPDRPGALGQVASRIGAVRGDVVGIEILERGGGSAIDELVVALPDDVTRELLLAEIGYVDGVAIEDVRPIDPERPDAGMVALQIAASLVEMSVSYDKTTGFTFGSPILRSVCPSPLMSASAASADPSPGVNAQRPDFPHPPPIRCEAPDKNRCRRNDPTPL